MMAESSLDRFEYVVVLMMENRSFDNVLGYLYGPGAAPRGQAFEGVAGKDLSNPIPPDADEARRGVVPVSPGTVPDHPNPDPGEEYPHVNTQLFGTIIPPENRYRGVGKMLPPFNAPQPPPAPAPMNGFVLDYIDNFRALIGRAPTYAEYSIIMHCFPPEMVPVLCTLAREFAVCDHWFCAVPSQTVCNRSFFHAASSSGHVVNAPYFNWIVENRAETIFERLEESRGRPSLSWGVYFDPHDVYPLTAMVHFPRLRNYFATRFHHMDRFFRDVAEGKLPRYAFVEPRLMFNHNDMHPPVRLSGVSFHSSVLAGDAMIHEVYDAVRRSDSPKGNNWQNTLLLITFDEHGGCYDHIPPPAAVPPSPQRPAGQMGFRFDRLGVRVPTVLISAYVEPGTVVSTPLDHATLIKTLSEKWDLGHLTERDRAARSIAGAFTRKSPRPREQWPVTRPTILAPGGAAPANEDHPLNDLQRTAVGLTAALTGHPEHRSAEVRTVGHAVRFMHERIGSFISHS